MNKRQREKHKRDALAYLESARKTAKLKRIPEPSEKNSDIILMPDGSRYGDIRDDLSDMKYELDVAGLTLADIGTDEQELVKLERESDRLNAPHRERMRRGALNQSFNDFGYDDA